jgi:hypothetical protein
VQGVCGEKKKTREEAQEKIKFFSREIFLHCSKVFLQVKNKKRGSKNDGGVPLLLLFLYSYNTPPRCNATKIQFTP